MTRMVQLFFGEKDGQEFEAPWSERHYPEVFFAITCLGDEELISYEEGGIPGGRQDELATLAYKFMRKEVRGTDVVLRYERAAKLDTTKQLAIGEPKVKPAAIEQKKLKE